MTSIFQRSKIISSRYFINVVNINLGVTFEWYLCLIIFKISIMSFD